MTTFDKRASLALKDEGMLAAASVSSHLVLARKIASRLAVERGETNADQVGRILKRDYGIESLGPAAGSLFKGPEWEFTGRRVLSARKKNHGREIKVWRLKK